MASAVALKPAVPPYWALRSSLKDVSSESLGSGQANCRSGWKYMMRIAHREYMPNRDDLSPNESIAKGGIIFISDALVDIYECLYLANVCSVHVPRLI